MTILVTGGAGFIGSHTCIQLLEAGYQVVVVDNLLNSSQTALDRVQKIAGKTLTFYKADLLDRDALDDVFKQHDFEAVIHFAGLKAVGESVEKPRWYYHNNVTGSLILFEVMDKYQVKKIVFSSSSTIYGDPDTVPVTEEFPLAQTNPYGSTKFMIERILMDIHTADPEWDIIPLRYFNPVGAHPSGKIGEDPRGIPNNLLPYISQVAVGKLDMLSVFGDDYDTPDGTGVRDYIHVVDLAHGHIKALERLQTTPGFEVFNLGAGRGYSVLEIVKAFEKASGRKIKYQIVARRSGDIAKSYADPSKANQILGWKTEKTLEDMCADAWRWQSQNPEGY